MGWLLPFPSTDFGLETLPTRCQGRIQTTGPDALRFDTASYLRVPCAHWCSPQVKIADSSVISMSKMTTVSRSIYRMVELVRVRPTYPTKKPNSEITLATHITPEESQV